MIPATDTWLGLGNVIYTHRPADVLAICADMGIVTRPLKSRGALAVLSIPAMGYLKRQELRARLFFPVVEIQESKAA